jgi:hypothetical protein
VNNNHIFLCFIFPTPFFSTKIVIIISFPHQGMPLPDSPSSSSSLNYLLPQTADYSLTFLLDSETSSLRKIVAGVLSEINRRQALEEELLYSLEYRELALGSERHSLRPDLRQSDLEQAIALDRNLIRLEEQKAQSREAAAKDIIELKKSFWHYWLMLQHKEAVRGFLR